MEHEAKWEPNQPLSAAEIEAADWQPYRLAEHAVLQQINTYFDTPDRALGQARHSLRLRNQNGHLIVTLKGGGQVAAGVHQREEIEAPSDSPDPTAWPAAIMDRIKPIILNKPLVPLFRLENERHAWAVQQGDQTLGELVLDRGTIITDDQQAPVHEVEWELKGDDMQAWTAVSTLIQRLFALTPCDVSKFQRGLALLGES